MIFLYFYLNFSYLCLKREVLIPVLKRIGK